MGSEDYLDKSRTFNLTLSVCAPSNDLVDDLALAIDNEHGYPRVRKVWYALVPHDGNKLCMRMLLRECAHMFKCAVTAWYTVISSVQLARPANRETPYPSLCKKHTTPVPFPAMFVSSPSTLLASVTSLV